MVRCMGCMRMIGEEHIYCPHCGFSNSSEQEDERYLKVGSVISGRYIIGKALGSGGFGITYIAWDSILKKTVAIKEYFPSSHVIRSASSNSLKVTDPKMLEQFESGKKKAIEESRCLARLDNVENVTDVFDCLEENNTAYIIMEYLEGKTLKALLSEAGTLSFEKAMEIIIPVIDSLSKVHDTGLIHRDISPDNIFLCNDSKIKILDFGSARYAYSEKEKTFTIVLKHGFAPVEQYSAHSSQGPWTDVYAVAATLYMMITGKKPVDSIERVRNDTLCSPAQLGVKIPSYADTAIMDALGIDDKSRTRNMQSFKRGLSGLEARKGDFENQNKKRTEREEVVEKYVPENKADKSFNKFLIGLLVSLTVLLGVLFAVLYSKGYFEKEEVILPSQSETSTTEQEEYIEETQIATEVRTTTEPEITTEEETTTQPAEDPVLVLEKESSVVTYSETLSMHGLWLPEGWNSVVCEVENEEIARVDVIPVWQNKWRIIVSGIKVGKTSAHIYLKDNPDVYVDLPIDVILVLNDE